MCIRDRNLRAHPSSKDLTLKQDKEAVRRSIRNIVMTNKFERPFKPNFGANLVAHLFELNDAISRERITKDVIKQIEMFEPRVKVFDIFFNDLDTNDVNITIHYGVRGASSPAELTVFLKRVR